MDTLLKRPAREPRSPARLRFGEDSAPEGRTYVPEGTEKSPSSLDQEGLCKGLSHYPFRQSLSQLLNIAKTRRIIVLYKRIYKTIFVVNDSFIMIFKKAIIKA
jgi:hypothetical protein